MDTLVAVVLARLLVTSPGPQSVTVAGDSLTCTAVAQREIHPNRHHVHGMFCIAEATGEVRGAIQNRAGGVVCQITGHFDGRCLTIERCGNTETKCG